NCLAPASYRERRPIWREFTSIRREFTSILPWNLSESCSNRGGAVQSGHERGADLQYARPARRPLAAGSLRTARASARAGGRGGGGGPRSRSDGAFEEVAARPPGRGHRRDEPAGTGARVSDGSDAEAGL